ncbi:MAG: hypothetical protein ACPH53_05200 [Flavobacteriaceae bacterium]
MDFSTLDFVVFALYALIILSIGLFYPPKKRVTISDDSIVAGSGDEYENYNAYCDSNGTFSNQWVVYLIKFSESGKVEWQNIYFDTEGGDWAGEAITLTNENEAVVAVDNGSFGFLKINSF